MRIHGTVPGMSEIHLEGRNDAMLCACGFEIRQLYTLEVPHDLFVFDMLAYGHSSTSIETEEQFHGIKRTEVMAAFPSPWGKLAIHGTIICPKCHVWQTYEFQFDGNLITQVRDIATPRA